MIVNVTGPICPRFSHRWASRGWVWEQLDSGGDETRMLVEVEELLCVWIMIVMMPLIFCCSKTISNGYIFDYFIHVHKHNGYHFLPLPFLLISHLSIPSPTPSYPHLGFSLCLLTHLIETEESVWSLVWPLEPNEVTGGDKYGVSDSPFPWICQEKIPQ